MKRLLPIAAALVIGTSTLTACGPEPMTVDQACGAWKDMMLNAPVSDKFVTAEYRLGYFQDWEKRIDGAVGEAFAQGAEAERLIIKNDEADVERMFELLAATRVTLTRICGDYLQPNP